MAKRYTKNNSNYLIRNQHQRTELGTIMERDWVTTNGLNVLRFGPGRRAWYNSGNFVFTTSNIPTYHKKHRLSTETNRWSWDDCKTADDTVNTVKPNQFVNDVREYAYYGSCTELIRATVEDIVMDFPGRLITSKLHIEDYDIEGYIVRNDFNIDLHHKLVTLGKYDNELRFMSNSWSKYCIKDSEVDNNTPHKVVSFTIGDWKGDKECPQNNEGMKVVEMTFVSDFVDAKKRNKTYTIEGYYVDGVVQYVYNGENTIIIQPQEEIINDYFFNLKGFKGQLLRQDTKPYYLNKFRTPIEFNFRWYYPERYYVWPSNDYCIDISSSAFETFYESLLDMGQKYDELWTDNIYRSMTHESIKNFDWTYSRGYYEGEEQDNIEGGERMMKILRVFGRVFDDIKCYIDYIKYSSNITYDRIKNAPEALLSDTVTTKGVDVVSSIGSDYDIDTTLTSDFFNDVTKDISWCGNPRFSTHDKWYQHRNLEDVFPDICDNELMRRFALSVKRLMQTKGTQHGIDMVMGMFGFGRNPFNPSKDDDYTITEEAFYTKKLIKYNECINGKDDNGDVVGEDWTPNDGLGEITSSTKGGVIAEINSHKNLDLLYYDDTYSGVPLRTVLIGKDNTPFVVPFYDIDNLYDGNLVFQGKGGWGKMVNSNDNDASDDCFDYQETMSYLRVVGTVSDLLSVNVNVVKKYDIYYVVNLNDYTDYNEKPPVGNSMSLSHYFVLTNAYEPNKFSSWQNIVIATDNGNIVQVKEDIFKNYFSDDTWTYKSYSYDFKHMEYMESILSTNVGNNPHVGYGNYDDGKEFIDYMEQPFKYSLDKKLITEMRYSTIAEQVKFDDISTQKVTDKIQILGLTKNENGDKLPHFNENGDNNDESQIWYINTKVLTITNNVKSDEVGSSLFKNYFRSVIMPYLMQLIPSTTILKLKDF